MAMGPRDVQLLATMVAEHALKIGPDRAAIIVFPAAFNSAAQVKLQIARLEQVGAGQRRDFVVVERMRKDRSDENHQLLLAGSELVEPQDPANDRQVTEERYAAGLSAQIVLNQAR